MNGPSSLYFSERFPGQRCIEESLEYSLARRRSFGGTSQFKVKLIFVGETIEFIP